mgnify:CR=1 FL=1
MGIHLYGGSLNIYIEPIEESTLVGIPIYLDVSLTNNTENMLEIPDVNEIILRPEGQQICRKTIIEGNINTIFEKDSNIFQNQSHNKLMELPIIKLKRGETVRHIIELGTPSTAGTYTFQIECDFPEEMSKYTDMNYSLDRKIYSGMDSSNRIVLKVLKPQGDDDEIYQMYVKKNIVNRDKALDVMQKYPESKYSCYYAIRKFTGLTTFTGDNSPLAFGREEYACKQSAKVTKIELDKVAETDEIYAKSRDKQRIEIKALESVIKKHGKSKYLIPMMYVLASKCIGYGSYDKAFNYFQLISNESARLPQDYLFIESASNYVKYMPKYLQIKN